MSNDDDGGLRARLRAALPTAMKARDKDAVAALRSALGALDDAEAIDPSTVRLAEVVHERIAGTVGGLGAGEVQRATLTEERARGVVESEIAERRAAALDYDRHGRDEQAARLRAQADVLARLLDQA